MQNASYPQTAEKAFSFPSPNWGLIGIIFAILLWAAAYVPLIDGSLGKLLEFIAMPSREAKGGPWLKSILLGKTGLAGLELMAPICAALFGVAVYSIIKAFGIAPIFAALGAVISILLPILGLSPDYIFAPDDAIFAAMVLLGFANLVKSIGEFRPGALALAFFFSCIACWFRPMAAWPIFSVFLISMFLRKDYSGRPFYGLISALCWGPGLFISYMVANKINNPDAGLTDFNSLFQSGFENYVFGWAQNFPFFLAFGIIGIISLLVIAFRKSLGIAIAALLFVIIAAIGAVFYGPVYAAQYIFANLTIGLAVGAIAILFQKRPIRA